MLEQVGYDPNSEQAHNGERKGAENDFSTQLQERLQTLAERNPKTNFEIGFATRFEDDAEGLAFEVTLDQQPGKNHQNVRFSYGGVSGGFANLDGAIMDISAYTYNNPEAHLIDWQRIVDNDEAPAATREIAQRMQSLTTNPESTEPANKKSFSKLTALMWDTVKEIDGPVIYSTFARYKTLLGEVTVNAFGDMANVDGEYLSDDKKPGQYISVHASDFSYYRELQSGNVWENYSEPIDEDNLPPLTEEERTRHPYVVITAEQGKPRRNGDEISFDKDGEPAEILYPDEGYTVISANINGPLTTMMQTWHKTETEAQKWADHMYQSDLAHERQDTTMNPERQKAVLDVLDAALLTTELETP